MSNDLQPQTDDRNTDRATGCQTVPEAKEIALDPEYRRFLVEDCGVPESEVEAMAQAEMVKAKQCLGGLGSRHDLKVRVKECCTILWAKGHKTISAHDVHTYARDQHGYYSDSARGIGDALGRGKHGHHLEVADQKKDGRRAYRIPDPNVFVSWYQSDVPLPASYYDPAYFRRLGTLAAINGDKTFFQSRRASASPTK